MSSKQKKNNIKSSEINQINYLKIKLEHKTTVGPGIDRLSPLLLLGHISISMASVTHPDISLDSPEPLASLGQD